MAFMEIRHLKKYFNTAGGVLHAVDDVSLDIEKSQTLGSGRRVRMWKIPHWGERSSVSHRRLPVR